MQPSYERYFQIQLGWNTQLRGLQDCLASDPHELPWESKSAWKSYTIGLQRSEEIWDTAVSSEWKPRRLFDVLLMLYGSDSLSELGQEFYQGFRPNVPLPAPYMPMPSYKSDEERYAATERAFPVEPWLDPDEQKNEIIDHVRDILSTTQTEYAPFRDKNYRWKLLPKINDMRAKSNSFKCFLEPKDELKSLDKLDDQFVREANNITNFIYNALVNNNIPDRKYFSESTITAGTRLYQEHYEKLKRAYDLKQERELNDRKERQAREEKREEFKELFIDTVAPLREDLRDRVWGILRDKTFKDDILEIMHFLQERGYLNAEAEEVLSFFVDHQPAFEYFIKNRQKIDYNCDLLPLDPWPLHHMIREMSQFPTPQMCVDVMEIIVRKNSLNSPGYSCMAHFKNSIVKAYVPKSYSVISECRNRQNILATLGLKKELHDLMASLINLDIDKDDLLKILNLLNKYEVLGDLAKEAHDTFIRNPTLLRQSL